MRQRGEKSAVGEEWTKDLDPIGRYLQTIRHKILPEDEVKALSRSFRQSGNTDIASRNRIVLHNLRLVVSVAKRYRGWGLELHDLCQEGIVGLIHAAELFNPEFDNHFSTYAVWWIKQTITRAIVDRGLMIRIPVHVAEWLREVSQAAGKLASASGSIPTAEDVAAILQKPVDKVQLAFEQMSRRRVLYLADLVPVDEWGKQDIDSFLPMADLNRSSPEDVAAAKQAILQARSFLARVAETAGQIRFVSDRDQRVFLARYGLDGSLRFKTLAEVGKLFGMSRERVRQILVWVERRLVKRGLKFNSGVLLEVFSRIHRSASIAGQDFDLPQGVPLHGRRPDAALKAAPKTEEEAMAGRMSFSDEEKEWLVDTVEVAKGKGQVDWEAVRSGFERTFKKKPDVPGIQGLYYRSRESFGGKGTAEAALGPSLIAAEVSRVGGHKEITPAAPPAAKSDGIWDLIARACSEEKNQLAAVESQISALTAERDKAKRQLAGLEAALKARPQE